MGFVKHTYIDGESAVKCTVIGKTAYCAGLNGIHSLIDQQTRGGKPFFSDVIPNRDACMLFKAPGQRIGIKEKAFCQSGSAQILA